MKYLITFQLIFITFISAAQTEAEKVMKKELESPPYRESSEIPQSYLIAMNRSNTFIEDSINYIQAVAHGYDDTGLEGFDCTVTRVRNTNSYEVNTPNSGECRIAIYGINTTTKKRVPLGVYNFKIAEEVYHTIKLDGKISGEVIKNETTSITCDNLHYWNSEETITLLEWTMESGSKSISGKGEKIDKITEQWLKSIPPGQAIVVKGKANSNFIGEFNVTSVFLKGDS